MNSSDPPTLGRGEPPLAGGVPYCCDGIGEARRAVKSARGTEAEYDRGCMDAGDDDRGGGLTVFLDGEAILLLLGLGRLLSHSLEAVAIGGVSMGGSRAASRGLVQAKERSQDKERQKGRPV